MANITTSKNPARRNPFDFLLYSKKIMRPLVALAVLLVIWQILCSG